MARRRTVSSPFSLFAFQDIITSVTGIMVLITLLLCLELVQRKFSPPRRTAELSQRLESAVAANESEIRQLRERLAEGRARLMQVAGLDSESAARKVANLERQAAELRGDWKQASRERDAAERRQQSARQQEAQVGAKLEQTLKEARQETARKKNALEKLRRSNRLVFNPRPNASKRPWLAEVTARGVSAAAWGKSAPPQVFPSASELSRFLASRNPATEYFVLFVKPDGVEHYERARRVLEDAGFDVGLDLLNADQTVVDPATGAAVE